MAKPHLLITELKIGMNMQITDTIHFVEGRDLDSNMYLILDSNNDMTLIDTGHDENRRYLFDYIDKIGCNPNNIKNVMLNVIFISSISDFSNSRSKVDN